MIKGFIFKMRISLKDYLKKVLDMARRSALRTMTLLIKKMSIHLRFTYSTSRITSNPQEIIWSLWHRQVMIVSNEDMKPHYH